MTRIRVDNTNARLLDTEGARVAYDYLSYRPEGFQFTPAYKRKRWDGWRHLFNLANSTFPAGLAWDVAAEIRGAGGEVTILDERERPEPHPLLDALPLTVKLEPHQYAASMAIAKAGRGVIHHPVGAGKSVTIVDAARRIAVPSLILVTRKELLRQQYEQFVKCLGRRDIVGVIGDGEWRPSLYTVATIQSIMSKMRSIEGVKEMREWLAQWGAVFVDECQHLPSTSYERLMSMLPNAYFRIGLSATPMRGGKKEQELLVKGLTGPIIHSEGFLVTRQVPVDVFMVEATGYQDKGDDYPHEVAAGIIRNAERNAVVVGAAESFGALGPVLVLTERIEHGERLRDLLLDAGHEEVP